MAGLDGLRAAFAGRLLTEGSEMAPFVTDWRRRWTGRALAVAQPADTAGVAAILRWCHAARIPVVPQGGNTSLCGGSVPDGNGEALVLSLTRLNRVRAVDPVCNTITVEAGCTLRAVQEAAEAVGRLFPLSLAAEGSCTIGGNLATNAGGVQVLRYGSARDLCLGLEVVTAGGDIWDGLRALRKDNTGYDLRGLFIGSEGTLGVITAAVLQMFPRPAGRAVAFVAVPSPDAALRLLGQAQARIGAGLTAFEFFNDQALSLVLRHRAGTRHPLAKPWPWYVLIENASYSAGESADGPLLALLEDTLAESYAMDAAVAASGAQFAALWELREAASDSHAAEGGTIKHDISLPISAVADFLAAADLAMQREFPGVRLVTWGHLGDGNLHYNMSPPEDRCCPGDKAWFLGLEPAVNRLVHDLAMARGGSISAEHGLGVLRRDEAARYKSGAEMRLMRAVKGALDPLGLMNPGKVLP
jgi:FAD/FMN-containing dehydrogenase